MKSQLPAFNPMLQAICPSQRVIVNGGPKDTRLDVQIFIHGDDGKEDEDLEHISLLTPQVLSALNARAGAGQNAEYINNLKNFN